MAMTGKTKTKITDDNGKEPMEESTDVLDELSASQPVILAKQFVRGISKQNITNPDMNIWRVEEVDAYINHWMELGYRLVGPPSFMGEIPDGAYMMFYTMVKDV